MPVVRTFISLPAGFARMPTARFRAYTAAGCIPWTAGPAAAGYALGRNWQAVADGFHGPTYVIAAVLVITLAAVIVRRRARRTGAGDAPQAAGLVGGRPVAAPGAGRDWPGAGRQRRALQEAVSAAEFAVLEAQQAGAQTGELDALCLRLRLAVRDAEESLGPALSAYGPGRRPGQPPSPAGDLLAAAALIQDAAASAAASRSRAAAGPPADGLCRQAEAIAARIASAARATARITSPDS